MHIDAFNHVGFLHALENIIQFRSSVLMFVTPAFAQDAAGGGAGGILIQIIPFILIFVIFYFLLIRPQRQQAQKREEILAAIRRNDIVVTGGGMVGKVTKVIDDNEVEVEIAKDTKVRVVRALIAEVRVKSDAPAK